MSLWQRLKLHQPDGLDVSDSSLEVRDLDLNCLFGGWGMLTVFRKWHLQSFIRTLTPRGSSKPLWKPSHWWDGYKAKTKCFHLTIQIVRDSSLQQMWMSRWDLEARETSWRELLQSWSELFNHSVLLTHCQQPPFLFAARSPTLHPPPKRKLCDTGNTKINSLDASIGRMPVRWQPFPHSEVDFICQFSSEPVSSSDYILVAVLYTEHV